MRQRADRAGIKLEWIERVVSSPVKEVIQEDGRIRRWAPIAEFDNRYLRVVLLEDGETVHNAFFDRRFTPEQQNFALWHEHLSGFATINLGFASATFTQTKAVTSIIALHRDLKFVRLHTLFQRVFFRLVATIV